MSAPRDLEELAEQVDRVGRAIAEPIVLVTARAALNEVGILNSRRKLEGALAIYEAAQSERRKAIAEERMLREVHDNAVLEAEWELDGSIVTEGNKFFLVEAWCETCKGTGEGQGLAGSECAPCKGKRYVKARQLLAADVARWKAREAAKVPAVQQARAALDKAKAEVARTEDEVSLGERRLLACQYDLSAAIAQLEILRIAITPPANGRNHEGAAA